MSKKELLKRIKSLESYLGLLYIPEDGTCKACGDLGVHVEDVDDFMGEPFSLIAKIKQHLKQCEKEKK